MQIFKNSIFFSKIIEIKKRTETAEVYEQIRDVHFKKNFINLNIKKHLLIERKHDEEFIKVIN